jgi:hypothetical protein
MAAQISIRKTHAAPARSTAAVSKKKDSQPIENPHLDKQEPALHQHVTRRLRIRPPERLLQAVINFARNRLS